MDPSRTNWTGHAQAEAGRAELSLAQPVLQALVPDTELDCLNTKFRLLSAECSVFGKRLVEAFQDGDICRGACPGGKLVSHQNDIPHLLLGPCACLALCLCGIPVEQ